MRLLGNSVQRAAAGGGAWTPPAGTMMFLYHDGSDVVNLGSEPITWQGVTRAQYDGAGIALEQTGYATQRGGPFFVNALSWDSPTLVTYGMWVRTLSADFYSWFALGASAAAWNGARRYQFRWTDYDADENTYSGSVRTHAGVQTNLFTSSGAWHHWAGRYEADGSASWFYDGVDAGYVVFSASKNTDAKRTWPNDVAYRHAWGIYNQAGWTGQVGGAFVYRGAATLEQIVELANNHRPDGAPELAA